MMNESTGKIQYTFFGKVHPERCNVSVSGMEFQVIFPEVEPEVEGIIRHSISFSQVTATFVSDKPVENPCTLKNIVEDAIRAVLDVLGYTLGCGYDLEIIQMIDSLGSPPVVFGVGIPAINESASRAGIEFANIISLFSDARGQYLQRCLADLREAIRVPKDTGFFCFRGIESLRQFFLGEGRAKDDKASWELLRTELSVDRQDIELIQQFADPLRHGAGGWISAEERADVFTMTWNIVNAFIKYAINGYQVELKNGLE